MEHIIIGPSDAWMQKKERTNSQFEQWSSTMIGMNREIYIRHRNQNYNEFHFFIFSSISFSTFVNQHLHILSCSVRTKTDETHSGYGNSIHYPCHSIREFHYYFCLAQEKAEYYKFVQSVGPVAPFCRIKLHISSLREMLLFDMWIANDILALNCHISKCYIYIHDSIKVDYSNANIREMNGIARRNVVRYANVIGCDDIRVCSLCFSGWLRHVLHFSFVCAPRPFRHSQKIISPFAAPSSTSSIRRRHIF